VRENYPEGELSNGNWHPVRKREKRNVGMISISCNRKGEKDE